MKAQKGLVAEKASIFIVYFFGACQISTEICEKENASDAGSLLGGLGRASSFMEIFDVRLRAIHDECGKVMVR